MNATSAAGSTACSGAGSGAWEAGAVPRLDLPTTAVRDSFLAGERAICAEDGTPAAWLDEAAADFGALVASRSGPRRRWGVPVTELWYIREPDYIGTVMIRHDLTPALLPGRRPCRLPRGAPLPPPGARDRDAGRGVRPVPGGRHDPAAGHLPDGQRRLAPGHRGERRRARQPGRRNLQILDNAVTSVRGGLGPGRHARREPECPHCLPVGHRDGVEFQVQLVGQVKGHSLRPL